MKIAFIYDCIYPWIKGGGEKRIYEISKRLASRGHDVHIYGIKWWGGSDIIEKDGVIMHGVCQPMELYVDGRRSISEAITFSIRLLPHLYNQKFDIIDVTAFPYFSVFTTKLISIIKRSPMVITWHEVWRDYWYDYLGRNGSFGKSIENITSKLGKSVAVSQMTKSNLELIGKKNVSVIPNGIDVKRVSKIAPNIEKCDVIFVGRLIKEKNVDILIKAVDFISHELGDVKCHIIGNGPEKEKLIKLVKNRRLNDKITFLEFMEHDDILSRMKSSKLLVLPSSREGFGMVVIEAFACGLPVITTNHRHNATSELVSKETGFVIDLDTYQLGDTIYKLITDDMLQKSMSESAMIFAHKYDWEDIVDKLIMIYESEIKRI
jgi:glycosyltransferase involved in cell wall biosynthesis